MCLRSDVLSGVDGSESSSCWYSLATVVRGVRALFSVYTQEHFGGGVVDVLGNLLMCVPLISMCC